MSELVVCYCPTVAQPSTAHHLRLSTVLTGICTAARTCCINATELISFGAPLLQLTLKLQLACRQSLTHMAHQHTGPCAIKHTFFHEMIDTLGSDKIQCIMKYKEPAIFNHSMSGTIRKCSAGGTTLVNRELQFSLGCAKGRSPALLGFKGR